MSNKRARVLLIAPHLRFPLRNGADKYIAEKWSALPTDTHDVHLIGAQGEFARDDKGIWVEVRAWPTKRNIPEKIHNAVSILRFLAGRKQYLSYKYDSRPVHKSIEIAGASQWDVVVLSFISTYDSAKALLPRDSKLLIETHNYDPKIYMDRAAESKGLREYLYAIAAARAYASIRLLPREVVLCALGDEDRRMYDLTSPAKAFSSSVGMRQARMREVFPEANEKPVLGFVGSLDVQMNVHAIAEFVRSVWPILRQRWPDATLKVMGSRPTSEITRLNSSIHGIKVYANLSDENLVLEVQRCHATIVPFKEVNGMKLKIGLSVECGVPVVTTIPVNQDLANSGVVKMVCDTRSWIDAIEALTDMNAQSAIAKASLKYREANSWQKIALNSLRHV